jgi:hypothetical protein
MLSTVGRDFYNRKEHCLSKPIALIEFNKILLGLGLIVSHSLIYG